MQRLQQQPAEWGLQIWGCFSLWLSGRCLLRPGLLFDTAFAIIGLDGCCVWQHFHICFSVAAALGLNPQGTSTCTRQTRSRLKGGGWVVLWQKWLCLRFLCSKFHYIRLKQGVGGRDGQLVWSFNITGSHRWQNVPATDEDNWIGLYLYNSICGHKAS